MVKKLRERAARDRSQAIRLSFQAGFLLLNLWIGARFVQWVRWVERPDAPAVPRPSGIEGWLPIAGLMNLKSWLTTWHVPEVHPAAMFLLAAFLLMSLLLKKAFCSWLCPIGTVSEFLWKLGRRVARDNVALPKWLDIVLRGIKYLLLGFFALAIVRMPAEAIDAFMRSPYGLVADIKLLNFFRFISTTALVVIAVLIALSVVIQNFWCRYLCPYGALLGLAALFSPAEITRDADACIDCAKCTKACPSRLPVDVLPRVRSAECTMCMSCVAVCPAKGALEVKALRTRRVPAWAIAAVIALIFLTIVGIAKVTGHWDSTLDVATVRMFM